MISTEEGNDLIAGYMGLIGAPSYVSEMSFHGAKAYEVAGGYDIARYDTSWNWLMPVVMKICKENQGVIWIASSFVERGESWHVQMNLLDNLLPINSVEPNSILAVWECVVRYIQNKS